MLFNTLAFAKFFLLVFSGAWALSRWPRARFWFLATVSYLFYSGLDLFSFEFVQNIRDAGLYSALVRGAPNLKFVPIVFIGSTVDYWLSLWIGRTEDATARKTLVYLTIAMNTGLLLVFKYWDFMAEQVIALGGPDGRMGLPMPIGISFFTFMSLSYVVDVYRRELPPCRDYAHYVTYIAFFPHLVAGPIIRGKDLLPLFAKPVVLTAAAASEGIFLVMVGLVKKVIVSDYLAINLVDRVVAEPTSFSSVEVAAAMFGYSIQIYCDFSGYSDVAIGIALLLGYRLKINFDAPFKASNLVEFWRRWHISLSSWLRDYVYIPMGGSRVVRKGESPARASLRRRLSLVLTALGTLALVWRALVGIRSTEASASLTNMLLFLASAALLLGGLYLADQGRKYFNVWTTMVVCGIWHGAAWSYVLFGVVQGLAVAVSHFTFDTLGRKPGDAGDEAPGLKKVAAVLITFVFTTLTFVLIRAPLEKALLMYKQLMVFSSFTPNITKPLVLIISAGLLLQWVPRRVFGAVREGFAKLPGVAQAVVAFGVALLLRHFASAEAVPFVYGQF